MNLQIKKLTPELFDDFSEIMNSMQVSRDCFCYGHRVFPEDIELGFPAQRKMRELLDQDLVNGVIAYVENTPVLWMGFEPATELIGHDLFAEFLEDEPSSTWVIHCMTSKPDTDNRRELLSQSMAEAIRIIREQSAQKILAFPVKSSEVSELPFSRRFSGNEMVFESAGFERVSEANKYLNIWQLSLTSKKPKLSLV